MLVVHLVPGLILRGEKSLKPLFDETIEHRAFQLEKPIHILAEKGNCKFLKPMSREPKHNGVDTSGCTTLNKFSRMSNIEFSTSGLLQVLVKTFPNGQSQVPSKIWKRELECFLTHNLIYSFEMTNSGNTAYLKH